MGDGVISSGERSQVVSRESGSNRRVDALIQGLGAFGIYLALSFLFFGRALIGHCSDRFIGREADPTQMMWLLAWWPYALSHHLNPFLTDYVWAPVGFNFAWMTSTPLASMLAVPLTRTIGLAASLNVLTMLGAPTAAFCAFILCRRISHSFWPSMLGGFVFGFSSYMMGQTLAHLNLILVFPLPIATYLVVRWFEGSLPPRPFVILLAIALVCEFLIDMEILAMATLIAAVSFAAALYYSPRERRRKLARLIPLAAAAYAITAIVVSPYLYYFLFFGSIHQPLWPSERFSTDLLNLILPTQVNLLGTVGWIANTASQFPGSLMERDGFIALPLLAITIAWAREHWREPFCKVLVVALVVVMVAAVGPYLQIDGHPLFPMPWLVLTHIPLLQHALPSRLMLFPPLAIAMIFSLWLAGPETSPRLKAFASAMTVALMLPNPAAKFWASPVDTPAFFTDGSAAKSLSRNDMVLTLPWGSTGNSMLWQAECGMCFRNVSGYTAMERFEVRRWPIVNYFLGAHDLPEPELQLKTFLANNGVTAIAVDDANPNAARWKTLLATLGVEPQAISRVSLYRLNRDLLANYRAPEYSGVEMERRAIQSRFATLVTATDEYLRSGHDPARLSDSELIDLSLLPYDWKREPTAFSDMHVMPWGKGGAVILEMGSTTALADTMARFRDDANVVYLPFPRVVAGTDGMSPFALAIRNALLPPAAMPIDGESMEFLGMAFDRERLHKAAEYIARVQPRKSPLLSLARR
jgi:hypothetical protein